MSLSESITAGMQNPDCAFYVGAMMGNFLVIKLFMAYFMVYFLFKALDKLAWDPLLNWLRKKWGLQNDNKVKE